MKETTKHNLGSAELLEMNVFLFKTNSKRKIAAVFFVLSFFVFIVSLSLSSQMIIYPLISSRTITTFMCVGCFGLFMNYTVSYDIVLNARNKLLGNQMTQCATQSNPDK